MTEEFLHYIWKLKLFNSLSLKTTSGNLLEIIHSGVLNTNAGPDFFNARIKIDGTLWAGNVELHVKSSDWEKHNHQNDKAYDNVILHVVYLADKPLFRSSGESIPTLELKDNYHPALYKQYLNFKESKDWIPCQNQINKASEMAVNSMHDKLVVERLERKTDAVFKSLQLNNSNWDEVFYQFLARNFGFKVNAEPFEMLAKSLPYSVIAKHKNSLLQIEALLFGQAGLLNTHIEDAYLRTLQNEYMFLKHKFKLIPIEAHLWKFLRLRPVNFPTIRIAQFAGLIHKSNSLFSKVIETEHINDFIQLLHADVSDYWNTHYAFDKQSVYKTKKLGEDASYIILINTIIPFLFVYGKQKGIEKFSERALLFLEQIPPEKNAIVNKFIGLNVPVRSAYETQAILQLKSDYCDHKKCLQCYIGSELIKNS